MGDIKKNISNEDLILEAFRSIEKIKEETNAVLNANGATDIIDVKLSLISVD